MPAGNGTKSKARWHSWAVFGEVRESLVQLRTAVLVEAQCVHCRSPGQYCLVGALHAKLAAVQPGTEMTEPHRNHNAEGNVKDYAYG